MKRLTANSENPAPGIAPDLTRTRTPSSPYEPPAIIHRGTLETRAGSPLADPFDELFDPDNPLNQP